MLLTRYGTYAERFLLELGSESETWLEHTPGFSKEEIAFLVREEQILSLSDLIFRRTSLGFRGEISSASLRELAEIVGNELGWGLDERQKEQKSVGVAAR